MHPRDKPRSTHSSSRCARRIPCPGRSVLVVRLVGFDRNSLVLLQQRNFRIFAAGFASSLLGANMAAVALTFAVLSRGGSLSDLSLVLAARILPLTLFLLGGGVIGDRFPRRYVLAVADSLRLLGQFGLAACFLFDQAPLAAVLALCAFVGFSEALFEPAFEGLVPELATTEQLHDANALLGLLRSAAAVGGPAIAGVLVAVAGPVSALLVCAAGYGVSVTTVLLRVQDKHLQDTSGERRPSMLRQLRQGWTLFRSQRWLWAITLQFAMFNLLVWAPFLVLGPVQMQSHYGGGGASGIVMAVYGVGGAAMLGRRPSRPLVLATAVTIAWAAPSAALALRAQLAAVVVAAFLAGFGSTTFSAVFSTAVQQRVPADALSRIRSYVALGAFSLGPLGLAASGPVAEATSIETVLAIGVGWQVLANGALLAMPVIRRFRQL
ncbi:MFS transporter [Dactylosporangium roseum]|uniref:MFS transporter n=1 Tax=Dactylosporangium roseum TaxID=47989 RepID=A0ABY5Z348_9ACTN|nr:MFS transporter [Dactylosporangium roseum]